MLTSLQSLYNGIERHVCNLATLGKSVESYEDLLVCIVLNKLPPKMRKNMMREHDSNEWNLNDFQEAMHKEVRVFEAKVMNSHLSQSFHPTTAFYTGTSKATNTPLQANVPGQQMCAFCKGSYFLADSQALKDFTV